MTTIIGKILSNRYRIEEPLGRGGMAEVYKAWDQERATYLALKVLRQDLSRDQIFLRRFQREAHTLGKLQHPNIVRFFGIETDDLIVFMLMDFINGNTLQDEIFRAKGKPLSPDFVGLVMQSVCSALHYAHRQGLVHCDIKPGNIMIDESGKVLLTDFGIARMTDAATVTMVGFGTPAYMAPELVRAQVPTPQSDIYSIGVLLYEMVTGGERPFTGQRAQTTGPTSEKVRWEQIHLQPPAPSDYNPTISQKLEAGILRCLDKDVSTRFSTVLGLYKDIKLALPENNNQQIFDRQTNSYGLQKPTKGTPRPAGHANHNPVQIVHRGTFPKQPQPKSVKYTIPLWVFLITGMVLLCMIFTIAGGLPIMRKAAQQMPVSVMPDSQTPQEQEVQALSQEITPTETPLPEPTAVLMNEPTSAPVTPTAIISTATPTADIYITPTPKTYYPIANCAPSQLRLGDSAFIDYQGGKNSIRSEPDTQPSDNVIAEALPGEVLLIVGGPVCNYGWLLWEVETTRQEIGWTPETNGNEFWLLPLTTHQLCDGALPSRLVVGNRAKVKEEPPDANLLRAGPGRFDDVIGRIPPGDWMNVLEGPHCGEKANWWKVESITSGIVGWTMEGNLEIYYLAPEP
jgi:serine/threonine protein kinase